MTTTTVRTWSDSALARRASVKFNGSRLSRSLSVAYLRGAYIVLCWATRHSGLKHDDESDDAAAAGLIFEKARSSIRLMLGIYVE